MHSFIHKYELWLVQTIHSYIPNYTCNLIYLHNRLNHMKLPMLKRYEPIKMAIHMVQTIHSHPYICHLWPAFILPQALRISQTDKYSYFLFHILSHVFPSKDVSSHTNTPTHLCVFSHTHPLRQSYYSFVYFPKPNHAYWVTHDNMLKVSHSYTLNHSLTQTHSLWRNPGTRIL